MLYSHSSPTTPPCVTQTRPQRAGWGFPCHKGNTSESSPHPGGATPHALWPSRCGRRTRGAEPCADGGAPGEKPSLPALQLPLGQHCLDIQTRTKWLVPKGLPPAGHPTCRLLGLSRVAPSRGVHTGVLPTCTSTESPIPGAPIPSGPRIPASRLVHADHEQEAGTGTQCNSFISPIHTPHIQTPAPLPEDSPSGRDLPFEAPPP